jgi:glycosyl transferase family 2
MESTVSIVLPVYNCAQYVGQAIESMLAQTWPDFEFIVIDDGSTDRTPQVLQRYRDPRIRLVTQTNRGLAATLNRGIELSRGRYIARQDADDFSLAERLAKQVSHLDAHPSCALVGTWAEIRREDALTGRQHRHPTDNASLQYELLLNNPFVHSSVMIRKAALDRVGGYTTDPARQPPEDYELWSRIARDYEVSNLPEVLHVYREIHGSMSRDGAAPFLKLLVKISAENIAWAAGVQPSDAQAVNIASIAHGAFDQIQGKPDFQTMGEIFRRAAQRVVAATERARFGREAQRRIQAMRLNHPEVFGLNPLLARLERIARRSASLFTTS